MRFTQPSVFLLFAFLTQSAFAALAPELLLMDGKALAEARRLASTNDTVRQTVRVLRRDAEAALKVKPLSVMQKKTMPPSGDKHDYMSVGPYWWPNPNTDDGLPYIRRDGRVNPQRDAYDSRPMSQMASAVDTLALAWFMTRDERFAQHAGTLLRTWFLDGATRMNPHLRYGQAIPGRTQGRGVGTIDTRRLLAVVDAAILLHSSNAWTDDDHEALKEWFGKYARWLRDSAHGRSAAGARNNIGTWYDVQAAAFALFSGQVEPARQILRQAKTKRIAAQIESDGRMPHELARTRSFDYTAFNVAALTSLAMLGDRVGVDVWSHRTEDGRSLRTALDWFAPYAAGDKPWPHRQITDMKRNRAAEVYLRAAAQFNDPRYSRVVDRAVAVGEVDAATVLQHAARTVAPKPTAIDASSPLMLKLPGVRTNAARIDFNELPKVPGRHAVISDVRGHGGKRVNQHAYLVHHAGRYWAIWSDGPGVPVTAADQHRNRVPGHDQPGTRVSFSTSKDGLTWSTPADLSGPPRRDGFGWIARGLWVRKGELLALASHFNAPGYPGEGLSLEAFRWEEEQGKWVAHGTVFDDTLNNFPPKQLPNGQWMMTRRDHRRQVSVLVGGVGGFNKWQVKLMAAYGGRGRPEEPYWYVLPDGQTLVGLIRDNSGSKRLLRTVSSDNGQNWSDMVKTNFPDATSKFFALRTSRGYYVLVSNANPRRRDPLTLAVSRDGVVFTHLFYLVGGRHVDYPHIIEHSGHLLVAFSGAKQTVEVTKVALTDIDALIDVPPTR